MQPLTILIAGTLAFGVALVYPVHELWGTTAVMQEGVSLLLCLVPATATLAWAARAGTQSAEQRLLVVLGGMGIRMVFVLGAGLLLYSIWGALQQPAFWVWLLVFYLCTLTLEMVLLVTWRTPHSPARGGFTDVLPRT